MKTTTNHNRASKMATALCAAFVFSTGISAQSNPDVYKNSIDESFKRMEALIDRTEQDVKYVAPSVNDRDENFWVHQNAASEELDNCVKRLDVLAANIEESLKYEAPSVVDDEINLAFERLEMLAGKIENEIRYRVPMEKQANTIEYAIQEKDRENETHGFLAFITGYLKNK